MQDNSTNEGARDTVTAPDSGGMPPANKRGNSLSALWIGLLGALIVVLVFFLLPTVARVRAGQANQGGDAGGKPTSRAVPLGPRQDVELGDAPVRGSRNAPVMIVEFADYQCPYCQQMHPELKVLQEELAGKVALAFKDFPLTMHENAEKAAEAARCAGEQGRYWDFHDTLFHNSDRLEVAQIKQYAQNLKLNTAVFETCLDSGKEAAAVQKDLAQGKQLGVKGTPSFFFNGRLIPGALDYYSLRSVVEGLLKTDAPASASTSLPDK